MVSSNELRGLLTSFSPSLDYFAISAGDGRIKIWDTVKGQLQTEFSDIKSHNETASFFGNNSKPQRGHLSLDYTCMTWLSLDTKKKRKLGSSLLVLGTGSGDAVALDVAAAQLKWTLPDCHPGGVSAVSFSAQGPCIYTAGADGMICKIDPQTGNVLEKFRASSKAISSMSVSPDGKVLATAAAQLRVFNCSDHTKIQKFSGHPGAVRCIVFSEDAKYILSCSVGERYVALWRIDGSKKRSSTCVLAMEYPAVFLDCRSFERGGLENSGLCVLAISETGVCYTWFGLSIEELCKANPTKISLSSEGSFVRHRKGGLPMIVAAKLQGAAKSMDAHMFVAYGLLVKPLFQKVVVHSGMDIKLDISQEGILLPVNQSLKTSKKGIDGQDGVTAVDCATVEDALLPLPKVSELHDLRNMNLKTGSEDIMTCVTDGLSQSASMEMEDDVGEVGAPTLSMEKQLRQLKILSCLDDGALKSKLDSETLNDIVLESTVPPKKMREAVLLMEPGNAFKLLEVLVAAWQSRKHSEKFVLPWIHCILVNHGHYIMAQGMMENQLLSCLLKITKSRGVSLQPLLQLSGRLQLVAAQIDSVVFNKVDHMLHNTHLNDEDDEEDIDGRLFGEEDSELSSDDDDD